MNTKRITKEFSGTPVGIITRAGNYANCNNLILLTTRKEVDEQAKKIINSESLENHYVHMNYECVFVKSIEENNMNNETITITINGKTYEVDFEKAEELGILKEKVEYPKSWLEFVRDYSKNKLMAYGSLHMLDSEKDSYEALGRLIVLRDWWWDNMCDGWRPNQKENFVIIKTINEGGDPIIDTDESWSDSYTLSFPSEEIRDKFLETYNDLIIEAKMFL